MSQDDSLRDESQTNDGDDDSYLSVGRRNLLRSLGVASIAGPTLTRVGTVAGDHCSGSCDASDYHDRNEAGDSTTQILEKGILKLSAATSVGWYSTVTPSESGENDYEHRLYFVTRSATEWETQDEPADGVKAHQRTVTVDSNTGWAIERVDDDSGVYPTNQNNSEAAEVAAHLAATAVSLASQPIDYTLTAMKTTAVILDLFDQESTDPNVFRYKYNRAPNFDWVEEAKHQGHFVVTNIGGSGSDEGWMTFESTTFAEEHGVGDSTSVNEPISVTNSFEVWCDKQGVCITDKRYDWLDTASKLAATKLTYFDTDWHAHSWYDDMDLQNPVLINKPLSSNGPQASDVRIRNVDTGTGGTFEHHVEESAPDGYHNAENAGLLLVDSGFKPITHEEQSLSVFEAGQTTADDTWSSVSYSNWTQSELKKEDYHSDPIVLAQVQTENGLNPVTTRLRNITKSGFEVRLQEPEGRDDIHSNETVGYVAIEPGDGKMDTYGGRRKYEADFSFPDDSWTTIYFKNSYSDPSFVAGIQTYDGSDPCHLRYRNLTSDSVEIKVEEDTTSDSETSHAFETVGYFVMESTE